MVTYNYRTWVNDSAPYLNAQNLQELEDNISSNRDHRLSTGNPHNTSIGDLTDVFITSPHENQFLYYDGSSWRNQYMVWRVSGSDIYFPEPVSANGKVGIGTSNPAFKLDLVGGNERIRYSTPFLKLEHYYDTGYGGTLQWLASGSIGKYRIRYNHSSDVLAVSYTHLTLPTICSV